MTNWSIFATAGRENALRRGEIASTILRRGHSGQIPHQRANPLVAEFSSGPASEHSRPGVHIVEAA